MSNDVHCNKCGSANSTSNKFCSECGTQLSQMEAQPTESICPNCNQNNKVESVTTIFQTQSSIVGYGDNREVRQTQLARTIMEALGSKPRPNFIDKLLFGSSMAKEMEEYEEVTSRLNISYYCGTCNLYFFSYKGKKRFGKNFKTLLREDLD